MKTKFGITIAAGILFAITAMADPITLKLTYEVTDNAGHPISSIGVGQTFKLEAIGQDVTDPPAPAGYQGVFAATMDGTYDPTKALIAPNAPWTVNTPQFVQIVGGGDFSIPGQISRTDTFSSALTGPGNLPELLWTVPVTALAVGTVVFTPAFNPNDPISDYLDYSSAAELTADQVNFVPASLAITPEPSTLALAALGFAALVAWRWTSLRYSFQGDASCCLSSGGTCVGQLPRSTTLRTRASDASR